MKKYLAFLLVLVIVMSTVGCSRPTVSTENPTGSTNGGNTSKADEKIVMKLSHVSSPGSARDLGSLKFKEVVERETNGRVEVQVYPASQLGGQRDQVEGVQFGSIEMAVIPTAYLGGVQPLITLLDTAFFLPDNPQKLVKLYESDAIKELFATTEEHGIKSLGIWHTGYKVYSSKKPINTVADMKGMKIRVMASPIIMEQTKILGMDGITMDFGETYSALQSGAIDGQDNPYDTIYDMKFHEVQNYITETNHGSLDQIVIFNLDWYNKLPDDIKQAIELGVKEGSKTCYDATYEAIAKRKQEIIDYGVKIITLEDDVRAGFKEVVAPINDFARNKFGERGAKLFDLIGEEINRINAE